MVAAVTPVTTRHLSRRVTLNLGGGQGCDGRDSPPIGGVTLSRPPVRASVGKSPPKDRAALAMLMAPLIPATVGILQAVAAAGSSPEIRARAARFLKVHGLPLKRNARGAA